MMASQVHRVGRTNHNKNTENDEPEQAQIDQRVFEDRQSQLILQPVRMIGRCPPRRDNCDQNAQYKTNLAGNTLGVLAGNLCVIVPEPYCTVAHGHKQNQPDKRVIQARPKQG